MYQNCEELLYWVLIYPGSTLELQRTLLKCGKDELFIAAFSFRSTQLQPDQDGIKLSDGVVFTREKAYTNGVGEIFERVIQELIAKMREVDMVRPELK